ncbi:MAG: methyltransferase [Chthoniobacterales bacterium]
MKSGGKNPTKELYNQLRLLSCDELWNDEVPRFDRGTAEERFARVAVIRAVGVVFSENGTTRQKSEVRQWLRALLQDPNEKVRRYAMTALPKLGAGAEEEGELLSLLKRTTVDREKKFLGEALDKIGGAATLEAVQGAGGLPLQTEQRAKASVARLESPSVIQMDRALSDFKDLRIHLRGREGLEELVRDEVREYIKTHGKFRVERMNPGLVTLSPIAPFTLGDIYALRCFGTVGFVIGTVNATEEAESVEALAAAITSSLSRRVLKTFTEGSIRYRLDFVAKGHQRSAVRLVANRAYELCPEILNDSRNAPWAIDIHPGHEGDSVELRPRLSPDPRLYFRRGDVPAASHPPLAACMARLAGKMENEVVWDPFCGSGLELVERALRGGVHSVYGTDRREEAVAISRENFESADIARVQSHFVCSDFRDFESIEGLGANSATLIITNPPMGKRVPIRDIHALIEQLFDVAAKVLKPGGRLVFANPVREDLSYPPMKLKFRQLVDFGGFNCHLEMYVKSS